MFKKRFPRRATAESTEFLWLISLSDLMMLLFILFVMLFSIAYSKIKSADFQRAVQAIRQEKIAPNPMEETREKLEKWVQSLDLSDKVQIRKTADAVLLEVKDNLLFQSGHFNLEEEGLSVMGSLAKILETIPEPLQVGIEGHTDDAPVFSIVIQNNWDLSAKRSMSVFEALQLSSPMQKRAVIMAYGDSRPLVPNRDSEGKPIPANQARNRRVTFRIF